MFWRAIHKQNSTGGISSNKTNPVYTKLAQAKYITLYYATFIILELPYMKPQSITTGSLLHKESNNYKNKFLLLPDEP